MGPSKTRRSSRLSFKNAARLSQQRGHFHVGIRGTFSRGLNRKNCNGINLYFELTVQQPYDNFIRGCRYQPAAFPAYGGKNGKGIWEVMFGDVPTIGGEIEERD